MTNKEFAEQIIARIEDHKRNVCKMDGSPTDAAYAQAHEHIIELIQVETLLAEASSLLAEASSEAHNG